MEKMVLTLSPSKYGKLLARTLPKRIETDAEFDRFIEEMENLSRKISRNTATAEDRALHSLLSLLAQEYDNRVHSLPSANPIDILQYLMEQRGLRPADLTPVFGARSIASLVLNGKRELSKTHIRKLADFFHVSVELFLGVDPGKIEPLSLTWRRGNAEEPAAKTRQKRYQV
jgi:HTH-type transcriptional regulator / antitoxin HigA